MTTGRINQVVIGKSWRGLSRPSPTLSESSTAHRQPGPAPESPPGWSGTQVRQRGPGQERGRLLSHSHPGKFLSVSQTDMGSLRGESIVRRQGPRARSTTEARPARHRCHLSLTLELPPSLGKWNEFDVKFWGWSHREPSTPTVAVKRLPTSDSKEARRR